MPASCLRLLVVDDNRDHADSLGMLLRLSQHDVQIAYDGRSAFQTALRFVPDVMLVDLGMPTLDGIRLAQLVRAEQTLSDTLLLAITGHAGAGIEKQAKEAGFARYLLKPVDVRELLDLLRQARSVLRASSEERRDLTDEIAEAAQRQTAIAAEAQRYLRDHPSPPDCGKP